jgi:hypothetical protein
MWLPLYYSDARLAFLAAAAVAALAALLVAPLRAAKTGERPQPHRAAEASPPIG